MSQKRCEICGELFQPAARRWKQQKVCYRASCQKQRKARAQRRFSRENPEYFRGRYDSLKGSWDYAGYLRDYRAENPEYVAADNRARSKRRKRQPLLGAGSADIQDAVRGRAEVVAAIRSRRGADIQDTVRLQLDGVLDLLATGASADIQERMAGAARLGIG